MLFDQGGHQIATPCSQCIEHGFVVIKGTMHVGNIAQVQVPHPLAVGIEVVDGVGEIRILRRRPHDLVTPSIELQQLRRVGDTTSLGQHQGHFVPVGIAAPIGGQASGIRLDNRPRFEEQAKLRRINIGHEHSTAGSDSQQLISLEVLDRFTDRRAADTETLLQFAFVDHSPRRELEGDDQVSEFPVGVIAERHAVSVAIRYAGLIYQARTPGRTEEISL